MRSISIVPALLIVSAFFAPAPAAELIEDGGIYLFCTIRVRDLTLDDGSGREPLPLRLYTSSLTGPFLPGPEGKLQVNRQGRDGREEVWATYEADPDSAVKSVAIVFGAPEPGGPPLAVEIPFAAELFPKGTLKFVNLTDRELTFNWSDKTITLLPKGFSEAMEARRNEAMIVFSETEQNIQLGGIGSTGERQLVIFSPPFVQGSRDLRVQRVSLPEAALNP